MSGLISEMPSLFWTVAADHLWAGHLLFNIKGHVCHIFLLLYLMFLRFYHNSFRQDCFQTSLNVFRIKPAVSLTVPLRLAYVNELSSDWLPQHTPHSQSSLD